MQRNLSIVCLSDIQPSAICDQQVDQFALGVRNATFDLTKLQKYQNYHKKFYPMNECLPRVITMVQVEEWLLRVQHQNLANFLHFPVQHILFKFL